MSDHEFDRSKPHVDSSLIGKAGIVDHGKSSLTASIVKLGVISPEERKLKEYFMSQGLSPMEATVQALHILVRTDILHVRNYLASQKPPSP